MSVSVNAALSMLAKGTPASPAAVVTIEVQMVLDRYQGLNAFMLVSISFLGMDNSRGTKAGGRGKAFIDDSAYLSDA